MAIYRCNMCGEYKDDDWCVGMEDPEDGLELLCEECYTEIEEEVLPWNGVRQDIADE